MYKSLRIVIIRIISTQCVFQSVWMPSRSSVANDSQPSVIAKSLSAKRNVDLLQWLTVTNLILSEQKNPPIVGALLVYNYKSHTITEKTPRRYLKQVICKGILQALSYSQVKALSGPHCFAYLTNWKSLICK